MSSRTGATRRVRICRKPFPLLSKFGNHSKKLIPYLTAFQRFTIRHHIGYYKAVISNPMKPNCFILVLTVLMLSHGAANAQACPGEVVQFRETFGSGTASAPLAAGRTNYNYNGTTSLADGDYELSNSTQSKPEWHNAPDHTGNTNGRMMVTNASYTPGEFYRDTVYGLSSTSTYTVYLYAMNVNTPGTCSPNPILPRLQLIVESYNIDGSFTQLSSMVSADIPQSATPTWVMISGTIYLPVSVTAVRYRVINNATGGCGNDVAIDDITFSQCAPSILPITGLELKGSNENNAVSLNWSARHDNEIVSFEVEKSVDGRTWSLLRRINAAASFNTLHSYSSTDNNPLTQTGYYRVAAINAAGAKTYSNVIRVSPVSSNAELIAYPNPCENVLTVQVSSGQLKSGSMLRLFDMKGKLHKSQVLQIREGVNSLQLNTSGIAKGMYFISITDDGGNVISHTRIIKR
ncbi:MAG: T9SS type A sorting domain-containing protein [Chitinophagaceae bacterium]|nr:T9SS type A sorting domain-containing protein [Chitinophagaceae bacterium]